MQVIYPLAVFKNVKLHHPAPQPTCTNSYHFHSFLNQHHLPFTLDPLHTYLLPTDTSTLSSYTCFPHNILQITRCFKQSTCHKLLQNRFCSTSFDVSSRFICWYYPLPRSTCTTSYQLPSSIILHHFSLLHHLSITTLKPTLNSLKPLSSHYTINSPHLHHLLQLLL